MRPLLCGILLTATPPALAVDPVTVGDDFEISWGDPLGELNHYDPAVGASGDDYLALWMDNRAGCDGLGTCEWDVNGAHIGLDGDLLQVPVGVAGGADPQLDPAIARGDGRYMVVWIEGDTDEVWAEPNGDSGYGLGVAARVSVAGAPARAPDVAWGGEHFFVTWADTRGWIVGRRVSTAGIPIDVEPIRLSDQAGLQHRPRVASDGEHFLVVWDDGSDVFGTRVRQSDGAVVEDQAIEITNGVDAALAWDGTHYFAVAVDNGIHAVHLDPDGAVRTGVGIRGGAGGDPDVVSLDPGFLVVYAENREGDNEWGSYGIYGMRIDPDGNTVDNGIPGELGSGSFEIAYDSDHRQWQPRIAGRDGRFLVTWLDSLDLTPTPTTQGVYGAVLEVPAWDAPADTGDTGLADTGVGGETGPCSVAGGTGAGWWTLGLLLVAARRRVTAAE